MGSIARGLITGFICRLCSKMNRYVILIYGEEGERMRLAEKINSYLPITVNRHDPLPKTICIPCVDSLEGQHILIQQIRRVNRILHKKHKEAGASTEEGSGDDDDDDDSDISANNRERHQLHDTRLSPTFG